MLEVIAAAFPGSRLRVEQGAIAGPLHYEGQFHSIRLRFDPFIEVFVDLPPLDDFELLIQWGDRDGDRCHRVVRRRRARGQADRDRRARGRAARDRCRARRRSVPLISA